jgi:hypothetical protein
VKLIESISTNEIVDIIHTTITKSSHPGLLEHSLGFFRNISRNEKVKNLLLEKKLIPTINTVLKANLKYPKIVTNGCAVIASIGYLDESGDQLSENDGVKTLYTLLNAYSTTKEVETTKIVLQAIVNCANGNEKICLILNGLNFTENTTEKLSKHPDTIIQRL